MDNILTEGYLCKKSQFLGSQRRRWTVLKGKYLTTYKQKQIYQNPTETFDLSVYDKLEYKDKNDVKFKLLSTRKNIKERIFMAESFDDMKQWVKSMQIMQQSLKQNKHHKINNKLNTKQSKQEEHTPPINTRHMNQTNIVINNHTRNHKPFQKRSELSTNSKNVIDLNDNNERKDNEVVNTKQEIMYKIKEVEQLKNKMKQISQQSKIEYKGPQIKVKLEIGAKVFMTSTSTLCDKTHGKTLFFCELLGIDCDDIKYNDDYNEGINHNYQIQNKIIETKKNNIVVELFFDRDPTLFPYILNYLRGYPVKSELYYWTTTRLEYFLNDAIFYKINTLQNDIKNVMLNKFNANYCCPHVDITNNGLTITRNSKNNSASRGCRIYGTMYNGKSYSEFRCIGNGDAVRFGVTQTDCNLLETFPGGSTKSFIGCTYTPSEGKFYFDNGKTSDWGKNKFGNGDKCGILLHVNNNLNIATVSWYINGKLIKEPVNLKDYLDVSKGVAIVVTLFTESQRIMIVTNAKQPK